MSRSTAIRDRLIGHCETLNILHGEISTADWKAMPLALQFRFGWMPPIDLDALKVSDNLIAIIAPDLLDAVTAHLSDEDLDTYLTVVELVFDVFVAHQGEPVEEIERMVEDLLIEQTPDAARLRTEVELRALDNKIVPVIG